MAPVAVDNWSSSSYRFSPPQSSTSMVRLAPLRRNSVLHFSLSLTCRPTHMDVDTFFDTSRIPKEVLHNIFLWAVREDHWLNTHSLRMRARLARYVSHTNKRWREAALECPELWTGPILDWFAHPVWLETVLARSSPRPIEVVIPLDAPLRRPRVVEQALQHLVRIRTLVLDLGLEGWQDVMQKRLLQDSAPVLEFCRLTLHAEGQPDSRTPLLNLNKALLQAPKLQTLELISFPFVVPRGSHNLTSLVVRNIPQQSAAGILLVLGTLTRLEHLVLDRQPCSRRDHTAPLANKRQKQRPINLSRLQSLSISSDTSFCAGVLKHIKIPTKCSTSISCFDVQATSKDTQMIFAFMLNRVDCWEAVAPIAYGEGQQYLDLGKTLLQVRVESDMDGPSPTIMELAMSWDHDPDPLLNFEQVFKRYYMGTFVQYREDPLASGLPNTLNVRIQPNLPLDLMLRLLVKTGWTTDIEYITTLRIHTIYTFNILYSFMRPSADDHPDETAFPHLLDIHLIDVNLSHQRFSSKLRKYLKIRLSQNWKIQCLKFIRCIGKPSGGYGQFFDFVDELWINDDLDSGDDPDTETEDGYASDRTVRERDVYY